MTLSSELSVRTLLSMYVEVYISILITIREKYYKQKKKKKVHSIEIRNRDDKMCKYLSEQFFDCIVSVIQSNIKSKTINRI